MENKSIRLRTTPGSSKNIMVKIDQEFDFLEVLSLKISQEELYSSFCANYGVIIGRVIANRGFGIPNAKISIFVPISGEDEKNALLKELYPYKSVLTKNRKGKRYNLLLSKSTCSLNNQAVGSFPTKNEVLDNDVVIEIFEKYYKYTTKTNNSGDYMIFGVPTGTHVIHMDVDLSEAGIGSIRPYDLISEGFPKNLFQSSTEFKISSNLDSLPQIKSGNIGTDVISFWGDEETCEIGITRVDFDTNFNITPNSLFFGSIFTDDAKMSLSRRCNPKNKMGNLSRLRTASGSIKTIRVSTIDSVQWVTTGILVPTELEEFKLFNPDPSSNTLIDDNGNFALTVPNNIGHMVTNEFGELVSSGDPDVGIPTKGMYRFAMKFNEPPTNVKRRTATMIFPSLSALHGGTPGATSDGASAGGTEDQRFTTFLSAYNDIDLDFQTFEWKQIYTISQFIKKYKKGSNRFSFIGLKNTDEDSGGFNPMPYTTAIWKSDVLYALMAFFITIISAILKFFVILVILQFGFIIQMGFLFYIVKIRFALCFGFGIHIRPFGWLSAVFPKFDPCGDEQPCDIGEAPCPPRPGTNKPYRGFVLECGGDAVQGTYCVNLSDPCPGVCDCDCSFKTGAQTCCVPLVGTKFLILNGKCSCATKPCTKANKTTRPINKSCAYGIPESGGLPCAALEAVSKWACCVKLNLAEDRDVMRRCFFDAWLNGSAYLFQFKYRGKVQNDGTIKESFCGPGSDRTGGDNYKNQHCCPNGTEVKILSNNPYDSRQDTSMSNSDSDKCARCLIRGPGLTNATFQFQGGIQDYHSTWHNKAITIAGDIGSVGSYDLNDSIYCNAYYSTKIINLGRIEMCEDVLFEIEKCIVAQSCEIDLYEQEDLNSSYIDYQSIGGGVGTGYENNWDQNLWMNILQETSYQSPVEVLFYLLGLGKCNPKRLFRPVGDQGCHERELRVLHKYSSYEGASPYLQLKELSKIYTEIILIGNDEFKPGEPLIDDDGNYQYDDNGGIIKSGLEYENGLALRFSPCGNTATQPAFPIPESGSPSYAYALCQKPPLFWVGPDRQVIGRSNAIKNIPYFYFGLIAGKTSINKVRNQFFQK